MSTSPVVVGESIPWYYPVIFSDKVNCVVINVQQISFLFDYIWLDVTFCIFMCDAQCGLQVCFSSVLLIYISSDVGVFCFRSLANDLMGILARACRLSSGTNCHLIAVLVFKAGRGGGNGGGTICWIGCCPVAFQFYGVSPKAIMTTLLKAGCLVTMLLTVAGCADASADWPQAKRDLVGMRYADLLACAGPPYRQAAADAKSTVLTYERSVPFTIPNQYVDGQSGQLTAEPSLYGTNVCQAIISVMDGAVTSITERGNAPRECRQLFLACMKDRTGA